MLMKPDLGAVLSDTCTSNWSVVPFVIEEERESQCIFK